MATRLYGTSAGDQHNQVVEGVGSPTAADTFEFTMDLADNPTREQAMLALERIGQKIMEGNWPPA